MMSKRNRRTELIDPLVAFRRGFCQQQIATGRIVQHETFCLMFQRSVLNLTVFDFENIFELVVETFLSQALSHDHHIVEQKQIAFLRGDGENTPMDELAIGTNDHIGLLGSLDHAFDHLQFVGLLLVRDLANDRTHTSHQRDALDQSRNVLFGDRRADHSSQEFEQDGTAFGYHGQREGQKLIQGFASTFTALLQDQKHGAHILVGTANKM
mmetsp:Transcript_47529/g.119677  ORF Transcript_47529/g.119677 Transcript_47529/m.119677 type:complete len:211 (+) Transcript_47529:1180-1812(+)